MVTVTWIAPRDPVTPSRSSLKSEAGKVRPARNDGSPPPGARDSCAGGDVIDVDGTVSDVFIVGAAVVGTAVHGAAVGLGVRIGATGAAVGIRVIGTWGVAAGGGGAAGSGCGGGGGVGEAANAHTGIRIRVYKHTDTHATCYTYPSYSLT